jgi:clan AA aspartic protease
VKCDVLVDSGAAELALPSDPISKLKLHETGSVRVYTADGGQHNYRVFGIVDLEVQGRNCQVRAIELPRGAEPLLGAVPLEEMDWHISPSGKQLVPNPKSPEKPLLPLC